jgi:hypothetical protein
MKLKGPKQTKNERIRQINKINGNKRVNRHCAYLPLLAIAAYFGHNSQVQTGRNWFMVARANEWTKKLEAHQK